MKFQNLIAIFILSFSSCTKEINIKIKALPQKVIVNSLFCPDSIMLVHISLSNSMEKNLESSSTAELWLYENEILVAHSTSIINNYYSLFYTPIAGRNYRIEVLVPGFEKVFAESEIPQNCLVENFTCKLLPGFDEDWGQRNSEVLLTLKDDAASKNYYELNFFAYQGGNMAFYPLAYRPISENMKDLSIRTDSDLDFSPNQFYFSDNLFNGLQKTLVMSHVGGQYTAGTQTFNTPFNSLLKTMSKEYYDFRKSWTKHVFNQNSDLHMNDPLTLVFLGDPIVMYSNVNGGLGVFAGYNQQITSVVYVE